MKKTILFLLSAVLLLTVLVMPASAETDGLVTITSASAKVGDTVTLTVSLSGFDSANTLGVVIDAPEGLTFDEENSKWLLSGSVLETLSATKGAWTAETAQDLNTQILSLVYTVDEFRTSYPVNVTVLIKNNDITLGEQTVSGSVTVTNPATALTLSPASLELNLSSETTEGTLTAAVTPADTTDALIWSTSDSGVATVKNGTVTARKPGTATITLRAGNCSATCTVTVTCDHDYGDWTVVEEPTETEEGTKCRECTICGDTQTESIPCLKLGVPEVTVSSKASNGAPYLKWDPVEGAEKYEVYRSTSASGTYTRLSTTKGTSLTNTSAQLGNRYYYKVRAVAGNRTSEFSDVVSRVRILATPVVKVTNVSSTGKIKLTWAAVDSAVKYQVYRSADGGATYSLLSTTKGTSLTNTSTTAGNTYYYKVKAIHSNADANSDDSSVVSGICRLPRTTVKVTNVASSGKIKLTWDAVEGAVKYQVYRATSSSGEYTLLTTNKSTSLTNTSTTAGNTYYYKVKAIHSNADASSAYSTVVSGTCDLARPTVKVSNIASSGKIKLTWNAVEGAAKYQIYRATSKTGEYKLLATNKSTSLTNSSTIPGKTYYYKVRAIHSNSTANSADSSMVYRTCDLARPTVTVSLNAKNKPQVSWNAVEDALKYEIWYSVDGGDYTKLTVTTRLLFTHTAVDSGFTYSYKVRAVCSNTAGNSAYSTAKSVNIP